MPEARDTLSPPETAGDHRPRLPCCLHLPQEGLHEFDLTTVLDPPERRKPGQNNGVGCGRRRGDAPGGECRHRQLVVYTKDERGVEKFDSPWIVRTPATLELLSQPGSAYSGGDIHHQAKYPRAGMSNGARAQVVGGRILGRCHREQDLE